ncbi:MAG: hypothetical protein FJX52_08305 [Alphaproteobacteria bacterium]|nr:hypothetical protein [Alphaproteobacteria bacterium]
MRAAMSLMWMSSTSSKLPAPAFQELRQRDRGQCHLGDRSVEHAFAVERGENAKAERQRNRNGGGEAGEKQGVDQAVAGELGDRPVIGERSTEFAVEYAGDPIDVAVDGRPVEAEFGADIGNRLVGARLAQNFLGQIAGQHIDREEDHRRHDRQGDEAEADPFGDHQRQGRHGGDRSRGVGGGRNHRRIKPAGRRAPWSGACADTCPGRNRSPHSASSSDCRT